MAKKPRASARTKSDVPGAAGAAAHGPGHNGKPVLTDDEVQRGFLQHRTSWNEWKAKRAVVDKIEKDVKAALKADGYLVEEMKVADDLSRNAKSELKVTTSVKVRLRVAKWIGHPMGAQFDLFNNPPARPSSTDRAFDMGKRDSMENKPAKPPEGIDYDGYMAGYHEHQASIGKGFKAPTEDDGSGEEITSGQRVSRAEFKRQPQENTAQNPDGSPAAPTAESQ